MQCWVTIVTVTSLLPFAARRHECKPVTWDNPPDNLTHRVALPDNALTACGEKHAEPNCGRADGFGF
jgi:hypothetical protein